MDHDIIYCFHYYVYRYTYIILNVWIIDTTSELVTQARSSTLFFTNELYINLNTLRVVMAPPMQVYEDGFKI